MKKIIRGITMGGNAIKSSRRVERHEYFQLWDGIKQLLDLNGRGLRSDLVKSYETKSSHGDIDIIVETDPLFDWNKHIEIVFEPEETFNNGKFFSFSYKDVQVDIIKSPPEEYDMHQFFYSYNDMGLLLGKICYSIGLTLGYDGLRKKLYEGSKREKKIGECLIYRDPYDIMDFLGLDYRDYERGFKTLEDVFDFVATCRFFTKEAFNPELWNSNQRTRDSKRKNLQEFWGVMKKYPNKIPLVDYGTGLGYLRTHDFNSYYHIQEKHRCLLENIALHKEASNILNGNVLKDMYGWEGRQIGEAMKMFNGLFTDQKIRSQHIVEQDYRIFNYFDCLNLDGVTP